VRGCPPTRRGYAHFSSEHPVLFRASGFSDHPYALFKRVPPTMSSNHDPNDAEFSQLPHLAATLNRVFRAFGSFRHLPVWNTEYAYLTSPPKHSSRTVIYISQPLAAAYLNQAEYISWRNPRIASFMQYQLYDVIQPTKLNNYGGFASGLMETGWEKAIDTVIEPEVHHALSSTLATLSAPQLDQILGRTHLLALPFDVADRLALSLSEALHLRHEGAGGVRSIRAVPLRPAAPDAVPARAR